MKSMEWGFLEKMTPQGNGHLSVHILNEVEFVV